VPPPTASFVCQDGPAHEVVANFFETDPATIRMERGDRTVTMWRIGAAVAAMYEGRNVNLVQVGNGMTLDWPDAETGKTDELPCEKRQAGRPLPC
jgi:endonuclease YncB( thermonuclease family)